MKLKSAVFFSALKVAFSQLQTTMSAVEYHQLLAKIESGNFMDLLYFFEQAGVSLLRSLKPLLMTPLRWTLRRELSEKLWKIPAMWKTTRRCFTPSLLLT